LCCAQALLAGFAWYGLTEVPFDEGADATTQTLYLVGGSRPPPVEPSAVPTRRLRRGRSSRP
jgi:hypothetical protein